MVGMGTGEDGTIGLIFRDLPPVPQKMNKPRGTTTRIRTVVVILFDCRATVPFQDDYLVTSK